MNGLPNGGRLPIQLISPLDDAPDEQESNSSDDSQDSRDSRDSEDDEDDDDDQPPPKRCRTPTDDYNHNASTSGCNIPILLPDRNYALMAAALADMAATSAAADAAAAEAANAVAAAQPAELPTSVVYAPGDDLAERRLHLVKPERQYGPSLRSAYAAGLYNEAIFTVHHQPGNKLLHPVMYAPPAYTAKHFRRDLEKRAAKKAAGFNSSDDSCGELEPTSLNNEVFDLNADLLPPLVVPANCQPRRLTVEPALNTAPPPPHPPTSSEDESIDNVYRLPHIDVEVVERRRRERLAREAEAAAAAEASSSSGSTAAVVQPQPLVDDEPPNEPTPPPRRPQRTTADMLAALERMPQVSFNSALARMAVDNRMDTGQTYDGDDNFSKLSDEVLLHIFRNLPKKALLRVGLVCRRFHTVSMDESLWSRIDLGGRTVRAGALGRALGRGLQVLRLSQATVADPVFAPDDAQPPTTLRLQYLDLSMIAMSEDGILQLLSRCRQLRKLSLEHGRVTNRICEEIAANRELEVLNLTMASGLTAYGVRHMLSNLSGLQALNISWTNLDQSAVCALVECISPRMQRLNLAGCRRTMSDALFAQLVKRCPGLLELDASDCASLSSEAIDSVGDLKQLESLALSRCYNIPVAAYLTINTLLSLVHLDIFGVLSDHALKMLQTSFPEVSINKFLHSAVARPTVGSRRTSVWGQRTRD